MKYPPGNFQPKLSGKQAQSSLLNVPAAGEAQASAPPPVGVCGEGTMSRLVTQSDGSRESAAGLARRGPSLPGATFLTCPLGPSAWLQGILSWAFGSRPKFHR